jgi:hypothetical protein
MKYLIFSALLGLGLAGCSSAPQSSTQAMVDESPTATTPPPTLTASTGSSLTDTTLAATSVRTGTLDTRLSSPAASAPRSVAYQGEMSLQVDNFEQATSRINQLLDQYGAYPSAAHETRANGQHYQEMTLKVPATDFLHVVAALAELGHIDNKDITATDVTAELVTLSTRVNARQATVTKNRQLLAQATSPAQLRQLEDQSRQLQAELAADKARLQQLGLGTQGLWATLHLRYTQMVPTAEPSAPLPAFAPQFLASFNTGWAFILNVLIVVTNVWPLFLLGAIAWPVLRWWRRRRPAEY